MLISGKQQPNLPPHQSFWCGGKFHKTSLSLAAVVFVVELGMPHISLAAEENYLAWQRSLGADADEAVLERSEKLFPAAVAGQALLPLESKEPRVKKEYYLTVTAYNSHPWQTDRTPYTTGWQTPVRDGVVALNFLPLGSLVRFPDFFGDKIFVVEDRMNVRYPYRADIWMPDTADAKTFGLKYLRLEVLGPRLNRDYVLANFAPAFPERK